MSRIEQWVAFIIAIFALAGGVGGGTYWYLSKEVPTLITAELDKRDAAAIDNKPDEIVSALAELSTKVDAVILEQQNLRTEINDNFQFLIEKVMEL